MKEKIKRIILFLRPIMKLFLSCFYDKKYLQGKYFDEKVVGWKWAFQNLVPQKILGFNRSVPWPMSPGVRISEWRGIFFHPDDLNNFQMWGTYFSNANGGKIFIGRGTYIAPNVGLVTTNHDKNNLDNFMPPRDIHLGENCWIGMNAMILPGVSLAKNTIVASLSCVTKSIETENCVIAGVPAKVIEQRK